MTTNSTLKTMSHVTEGFMIGRGISHKGLA